MSLCPEGPLRAAMTDPEFWEHVFIGPPLDNVQFPPAEPDPPASLDSTPCGVCGSDGACAWDAEGRPLIHTVEDEENHP